jgi:hypothetical protein
VHDLRQAQAVLDLARLRGADATLVTAPGSAGFAGVGFWCAVERALGHPVVIDCGDDAGLVMAALREGSRDLLFAGPEAVASKLASMAGQLGGQVRRGLDGPVLELLAEDDPARRLVGLARPSSLEADGGTT